MSVTQSQGIRFSQFRGLLKILPENGRQTRENVSLEVISALQVRGSESIEMFIVLFNYLLCALTYNIPWCLLILYLLHNF